MIRHLLLVAILSSSMLFAQEDVYDAALAERLGGNENGMRSYHLVLLTSGVAKDLPKNVTDSLFQGHMANIHRLADEGKLVLAGPFGKNDKYRGLFIFTSSTMEETEALLLTDPAISGGALAYEIYPWYGTAAVVEIPNIHDRITKKK
jgi:uncharacterized protein YciI